MNESQRNTPRVGMPPIPVYDALTEELVGILADISSEGIGVQTRTPLSIGALYQWRFNMTTGQMNTIVECGVEVMRSKKDDDTRSFHTGARFILLPAEIAEQISEWCDIASRHTQAR